MMQQHGGQRSDVARLEDYIRAVQLRKWLVLALTLTGLILGYLYATSRDTTYTATASVLVRASPVGARVQGQYELANLEREREVLQGNRVAEAAAAALGGTSTAQDLQRNLSVDFRPDSDVLLVRYTSQNADEAAQVANAFAAQYAALREGEAAGFFASLLDSTSDDVTSNRAALQAAYAEKEALEEERSVVDAAGGDVASIDAAIAVANSNASSMSRQMQYAEEELNDLQKQNDARFPAAELLKGALTPGAPNGFGTMMLALAGLLLGALGGVVSAFLLERLDNTARDDEDVALALGSAVLGSVPTLGVGVRGGAGGLVMLSTGGSARFHAAREAFRRLRSSVQFLNTSSGVGSILVTSSTPGEGKSLTSANLAVALAQNGSRVVLVNADMRRPTLEKMFGMEANRPGLADYLNFTADINVERTPGIDNLWFIRAGTQPQNPGELLNSDRFEQLMKELDREGVDFIVVDTPPVLSTADAVSAARFVDGVLVVVDTERTDTSDLLRVRADLQRSGSTILGSVMNRQKFKRRGFFKRRDHYSY